jgi:hypothetical protein
LPERLELEDTSCGLRLGFVDDGWGLGLSPSGGTPHDMDLCVSLVAAAIVDRYNAAPTLAMALDVIARWELPETGQKWPDGSPMSYEAVNGTNGARDYVKEAARTALLSIEKDGALAMLLAFARTWKHTPVTGRTQCAVPNEANTPKETHAPVVDIAEVLPVDPIGDGPCWGLFVTSVEVIRGTHAELTSFCSTWSEQLRTKQTP